MEAVDLARWTRFAAKGGIGKCTAVQDCVAERAEDLMFLKNDEIIVLLQFPEEDTYLGYCEGVVGRFSGSAVQFHGKLKKPIMAKRQSTGSPSSSKRASTNSASAGRPPQSPSSSRGITSPSPIGSYSPSSATNPQLRAAAGSPSVPPVPRATTPSRPDSLDDYRRIPSTASSTSHYNPHEQLQEHNPSATSVPAQAALHPSVSATLPSVLRTHTSHTSSRHTRNMSTTSSKSAYSINSPAASRTPSRQSSRAPSRADSVSGTQPVSAPTSEDFQSSSVHNRGSYGQTYTQHVSVPPPLPVGQVSQPTPTLTDGSSAHSSFVLSPASAGALSSAGLFSAGGGGVGPGSLPSSGAFGKQFPKSRRGTGSGLGFEKALARSSFDKPGSVGAGAEVGGGPTGAGMGAGVAHKRESEPVPVSVALKNRELERERQSTLDELQWLRREREEQQERERNKDGDRFKSAKTGQVLAQSKEGNVDTKQDVGVAPNLAADASFASRSVYSEESFDEGRAGVGALGEDADEDLTAVIGRPVFSTGHNTSTTTTVQHDSKPSFSSIASSSTHILGNRARSILIEDESDADGNGQSRVLAASPDDLSSDAGFGIGMNLLNDFTDEEDDDDESGQGGRHVQDEDDTAVGSRAFQFFKADPLSGASSGGRGLHVTNPSSHSSRASSRSDLVLEDEEEDMGPLQTPMVYDFKSSGTINAKTAYRNDSASTDGNNNTQLSNSIVSGVVPGRMAIFQPAARTAPPTPAVPFGSPPQHVSPPRDHREPRPPTPPNASRSRFSSRLSQRSYTSRSRADSRRSHRSQHSNDADHEFSDHHERDREGDPTKDADAASVSHWSDADIYDDYRYSRYSSMYSGSPSSKSGGGRFGASSRASGNEAEAPPMPVHDEEVWRRARNMSVGTGASAKSGSGSEGAKGVESTKERGRAASHGHGHGERFTERESTRSSTTATVPPSHQTEDKRRQREAARTPSPVRNASVHPAASSTTGSTAAERLTHSTNPKSPVSPLTRAFRQSEDSTYSRDSGEYQLARMPSQSHSQPSQPSHVPPFGLPPRLKSLPTSSSSVAGRQYVNAGEVEKREVEDAAKSSNSFATALRERIEGERGKGRISPLGARASPTLVIATDHYHRGRSIGDDDNDENVVVLNDTPSPISDIGAGESRSPSEPHLQGQGRPHTPIQTSSSSHGHGDGLLRVATPGSAGSSAPPSPLNPGFPPSPSPTTFVFPQTPPLNITKNVNSPMSPSWPPMPSNPRHSVVPPAIPFGGIPPPGEPPAHMQFAQQQQQQGGSALPSPHQQQFRGPLQQQQDSSLSALRMVGSQRMGTTIHGYLQMDILNATGPVPISFLLPGMQPPPPMVGVAVPQRAGSPQMPSAPFGTRSPPPPSPLGTSFSRTLPPPVHAAAPGSPTALAMNGVPVIGSSSGGTPSAASRQPGSGPSTGSGGRSNSAQVPFSSSDAFAVSNNNGNNNANSNASPTPLPRANFFPQVGQPRPRSRSFSDFNSPSEITERVERTLGMSRSKEEGSKPSNEIPINSSPSSRMATVLSNPPRGKARPTPGPSPLSLPPTINPNALEVRSAPSSPLPTTTVNPRIVPSSLRPPEQLQPKRGTLRRAPSPRSNTQLTQNTSLSPTAIVFPSMASMPQRRNSTHSNKSGQITGDDEQWSLKPPSPLKPHGPRQSNESDRTYSSFNRSDMTSPPPIAHSSPSSSPMNRSGSLRSKISISALRPKVPSRTQREPSDTASSNYHNPPLSPDEEKVQIKDMEFELVRPIMYNPPHEANNYSDESDAKDAISIRTGPGTELEPRSPTGTQVGFFATGASASKAKNVDPNQSVQAHRDRELKWMSTINSTDAAQAKKSKKIKKLLVEGVPSSVRFLVWAHISNSGSKKVPNVYAQLSKRRPPMAEEIERHVQLSFPDNPMLRDPNGPLVAVLFAYIAMVPDLRYTRGLAIIAGHLLLQSPEEDAFWTFLAMMDSYLRPYFMPSSPQMHIDTSLFIKTIEASDSPLATKVFAELNVRASDVCTTWFSSVFAGTLPLEHLHRVWDLFLYEGIPFLFRVGLAILSLSRRYFLDGRGNSTISPTAYLLRPPPEAIPQDPEEFLAHVLAVKLKDDDIRKSRQKMEAAAAKNRPPKAVSVHAPSHPHLQQAGRPRVVS